MHIWRKYFDDFSGTALAIRLCHPKSTDCTLSVAPWSMCAICMSESVSTRHARRTCTEPRTCTAPLHRTASRACSERGEELCVMVEVRCDRGRGRVLDGIGDDRLDGKGSQRLRDRHGALRGRPASREGHSVRRAATLHVQVDTANDGGECVDEGCGRLCIARKDGRLLPIPRNLERALHFGEVAEASDRYDRAKLPRGRARVNQCQSVSINVNQCQSDVTHGRLAW